MAVRAVPDLGGSIRLRYSEEQDRARYRWRPLSRCECTIWESTVKGGITIRLEDLGYSAFFEAKRQALGLDGYAVARVIAEYRGAYRIKDPARECLAAITGKQMFDSMSREDYPAVGDWVAATELDAEQAVIHRVLPRKTILQRKYSDRSESQVIASNVDAVFIIESVDRDYNLNRFERYLAIVTDGNIRPIIILNKIDLISEAESDLKASQTRKRFKGVDVIRTSAIQEKGIEELAAHISRGETYCLLGSSGVGKSSLINKLLGDEIIRTSTISSHTGKGMHTTTGREMYFLENGGILIDNPGMREIGMADAGAGIENVFAEIAALAKKCRFVDCTHIHEPGCAVKEAIRSGRLDEGKLSHYLKLKKETEIYEMTKLDKRTKDRELGKYIKGAKKQRKKRGL